MNFELGGAVYNAVDGGARRVVIGTVRGAVDEVVNDAVNGAVYVAVRGAVGDAVRDAVRDATLRSERSAGAVAALKEILE